MLPPVNYLAVLRVRRDLFSAVLVFTRNFARKWLSLMGTSEEEMKGGSKGSSMPLSTYLLSFAPCSLVDLAVILNHL